MAKGTSSGGSAPILLRVQQTLGMSQTALGQVLGASRKTIARWQHPAYRFGTSQIHALAEGAGGTIWFSDTGTTKAIG